MPLQEGHPRRLSLKGVSWACVPRKCSRALGGSLQHGSVARGSSKAEKSPEPPGLLPGLPPAPVLRAGPRSHRPRAAGGGGGCSAVHLPGVGLGCGQLRPQVDAGNPQAGQHLLLVPANGGHSEGHLLRRKSQVIVRTVFSCHQRGKWQPFTRLQHMCSDPDAQSQMASQGKCPLPNF